MTVFCRHFAVLEDPPGRICSAKLVRPFRGLCFDARFIVRPLGTGLPVGSGFLVLVSILPFIFGTWGLLSYEHFRDRKEEESFVGNCSSGLPLLLMCILENIDIIGDPLYIEVISLHFIMQLQEVDGMATCAPRFEVVKKRLLRDVGIKSLCVS